VTFVAVPIPTPILRFIHVDNLHVYLRRGGLHAPSATPADGLQYRTIHSVEVQQKRLGKPVRCGPRGVIHDYVLFYFGRLSPMMLNLKTGRVAGYSEGQEPLIHLVSTCQAVHQSGVRFVFTDGHGLATFTEWFDDLSDLDKVDWDVVDGRYWADTEADMDRQRRKQAEFLVYGFCDWSLIKEIVVIDNGVAAKVEAIQQEFPAEQRRTVAVRRDWYYW